jgi:hypothetical protein
MRGLAPRASLEETIAKWGSNVAATGREAWTPAAPHAPQRVTVGGDDPHSQLYLTQDARTGGRRG